MKKSLIYSEKKIQLYTDKRHHLSHPIPYPMKIQPVGKVLTENEWQAFCNKYLDNKLLADCFRQKNGKISFIGEGGLQAAEIFHHQYPIRFHMRLVCCKKNHVKQGLLLADQLNLPIHEVFFKTESGEKVKLNNILSIKKL